MGYSSNIDKLSEDIQNELLTYFDGMDETNLLDMCDLVVKCFENHGYYRVKNEQIHSNFRASRIGNYQDRIEEAKRICGEEVVETFLSEVNK